MALKSNKKAQVTLFIIIAIILVVGIAGFFIYKNQTKNQVNTDVQAIYNHVQDCVDESLISGLALIGLQGGYIIPPESISVVDGNIIADWFYLENDTSPTIEEISQELSFWSEISVFSCVNFSQFSGFEITEEDPSAQASIEQEKVTLNLRYPLTIKKGDKTYNLEKPYKAEQPVRLGKIYDFNQGIVYRTILEPDYIDTDYLLSEDDFNVTVVPYDNSLVYIITDLSDKNKIDGDYYTFMFASEFDEELSEIEEVG
jgi:hypothetical protein